MPLAARANAILESLSTLMVIAAAGILIWTLTVKAPPPTQLSVESVEGLRIDSTRAANVLGTGPFAILEFSDFQCPYCSRFHKEAWPTVRSSLVDAGKARYVIFHFPLEQIHPHALGASQAAECAGNQNRFWDMRELLFDRRYALTHAELLQYGQRLDLKQDEFTGCLSDVQTLQTVRAHQEEGQRLGVTGTPTFFIGIVESDSAIQLVERIRGDVNAEVLSERIAALPASSARRTIIEP